VYVAASCSPLTPPSANAHTLHSWSRARPEGTAGVATTERSLNQTRIDFVIGTGGPWRYARDFVLADRSYCASTASNSSRLTAATARPNAESSPVPPVSTPIGD
jgi:hypothetical protein